MKFTKMHGLGNDYVYVNAFTERVPDPAAVSRVISDRYTGIGSDGLILIAPSRQADVRMEMYNADGSRGAMCGNGIRCVAKYAVERGLAAGPELTIETDSGVKRVWCRMRGDRVESVRVDMGEPRLKPEEIPVRLPESGARQAPSASLPAAPSDAQAYRFDPPQSPLSKGGGALPSIPTGTLPSSSARACLTRPTNERLVDYPVQIGGESFRMTCVSMGNPHAVIFVPHVAEFDLARFGPLFEHAPIFPDRVNLHVVQIDSRTHVTMRTWERGSGATRACGTGACAVCVACILNGRSERSVIITLPGGDLEIEWSAGDNHVYKTGPAVEVFEGEWFGQHFVNPIH